MKFVTLAAVAALAATPALAQSPAPSAAPAPAAAATKISVQTTPIGEIIKNPQAKAVLEKALPEISQYYSQISDMTLAQVAPMSEGRLNDDILKALQAEFDKL